MIELPQGLPTVGREQVPGYGSLVVSRWDVLHDALNMIPTLARRAFTTFGPFWLVAPLALRDWSFLGAAVTHHKNAKGEFADGADDALYAARDRILRAAHEGPRAERLEREERTEP